MVIAGHNDHVAWGFTALYADVQDLYVEKLDGKDHYEGQDGRWHALEVDRETIHVRGRTSATVNVQRTAHGPLLNPIFQHEKRPIALKWTLYDTALNGMPLYEIDTAANWDEFHAAMATWCWPTQNVVYADDQNHIAYHAIGRVPIRGGGRGINAYPIPHHTLNLRDEWTGPIPSKISPSGKVAILADLLHPYIPFDDMPHSVDPPSGFLATANSRVTTEKSPYMLTQEWVDPYRAERIYKLLENRDHLTPADMLATQTDIYSEVDQELAHRLAMAIDRTPAANAQLHQAAKLLRAWDGRLTADSPSASIVAKTRASLWPLLLKPKLGAEADDYHWAESGFALEEIVMHGSADWLPHGYKNWNELLTDAVRRGLEEGHAPADLSHWNYGLWHVVQIDHPLSTILPLISRIAQTGPQPLTGDTTTVKQVSRSFGPSQRFIMDWSSIDGSTENIVLGEAGNPLSPYYRDQWNDWYAGSTFPLPFTDAAIQAQTRHTLRLEP
jgi:penicillin amidase